MAAGGGDGHCVAVPTVALSCGKPMPRLGLGTASFPLGETGRRPAVREAVLRALDAGYRHLDTAAVYGTECAIGDAVAEAVRAGTLASRDEVYITSKLWIADAHPGHVLPVLRKTLQNLQMEYVDLYLVHFPLPDPEVEGEVPPVLVKAKLEAMDIRGVWAEMEECQARPGQGYRRQQLQLQEARPLAFLRKNNPGRQPGKCAGTEGSGKLRTEAATGSEA
ncbi:hypothetical protein U9M48_008255 [Paspalum notatum var. saurae]|uniref:NADP-dependent oxidoreductase domain-containing protein n=1 Tax=Paspalum notatum var. saurae TaxID=547442 RepID=A0AAQ3SPN1_PASNO